jgi:hypothetical protein
MPEPVISDDWALGADEVQWMIYQRPVLRRKL